MGYVRDEDKLHRVLGSVPCGNAVLHVEVREYQGGGPKVALLLRGTRQSGEPWENGLGRFPLALAAELSRLIALGAAAPAAVTGETSKPVAAPALPAAIRPPRRAKGGPVKARRAA